MSSRYIDFISSYCDSWCQRCAFTERCSHFAVQSALAMCDGDFEAALELAVGPPRHPGTSSQKDLQELIDDALADFDPSEKELEAIGRELDHRRERVGRHPLAQASLDYAVATHRWLEKHNNCADAEDPAVRDAIEVIAWDSHLIHVKIMRALDGRDEHPDGAPYEKSAIQSDWNGSAKVALISAQRSEQAWRVVVGFTKDDSARVLADTMTTILHDMNTEFPRAMDFRRPGFDEARHRR
jgi:hypothetical protein